MKATLTAVLSLCFVAFSFGQENFILPGHWALKNHGVDYPVEGYYTFGQKPSLNDGKLIRDNKSVQVNSNRTKNGIVILAYERVLNSDSSSFKVFLSDSMDRAGIPQTNGEYNFDWMESPTKVNQKVVDQFIYFLNELPEKSLVMMYSGYYHEIHNMPESFFDAIRPFSSYEVLHLEANSVWGYIGSNCGSDIPVEVATTKQDSLINITHSFRVECSVPSSIEKFQVELPNMYPNPFNSWLKLDLPDEEDVEISIFGMNGEVLFEASNTQLLELGVLPIGVYTLQLKTNASVHTQRIVKQ